jgi:hypothetical protein
MTVLLCRCGCGSTIVSPDRKGREHHFVRGHSSKFGVKINRICRGCEKAFIAKGRGQKYCSYSCHFPKKICACGCGRVLPKKSVEKCGETKYLPGHHWLGKKHTASQLRKIRRASTGKNNPNWQGGIAPAKYTSNFLKKKRNLVRKLFGDVCFLCWSSCSGKRGHVHHIDYNKMNNTDINLVLLCNVCHGRTIPKESRSYWRAFLSELCTEKEMAS